MVGFVRFLQKYVLFDVLFDGIYPGKHLQSAALVGDVNCSTDEGVDE